jgi:putative PIN family toxin of toxin-antitoxin system
MRIVLDTNLVVRAAGDQAGLGREILMRVLSDEHTLVISHSLFAEIRKVLHYPTLHGLDDADIQRFLDYVIAGSEHVQISGYHIGPVVGLYPTDDMVLLTATTGQADVLGTNNHHFVQPQRFAQTHGVRILRDTELIQELRRGAS